VAPSSRSAFHLVERITALDCRTARGRLTVPSGIVGFPPCLAAEAVGQLAAWAAMAASGFRRRPVAALAGEARIGAVVGGGAALELEVEIERCDDEAVAYGGWARCGTTTVVALRDCVGAMLPLDDFDDPQAVAARCAALRSAASPTVRLDMPTVPPARLTEIRSGQRLRAQLAVPRSAPYFADHFPRQPVFPATLLLDAQINLAAKLRRAAPAVVREVKMRAFILPGQVVDIEVTADGTDSARLVGSVGGRRVASARVSFASSAA
jgi:3-hydroxymyristoyl/3-hydroxydecanoyl-(acyl carrier protein) dehydratase